MNIMLRKLLITFLIFPILLILLIVSCDTTSISSIDEIAIKKDKNSILNSDIRNILEVARENVPLDTSDWFAYGVLSKGRSQNKVHVGYFNEKKYEIYEFHLVNNMWKMGKILKSNPMSIYYNDNKVNIARDYNGAIAEIYTGYLGQDLSDTWYVPGNQQFDGIWSITEEYVTNKPTFAKFIEDSEVDSGKQYIVTWVGPWVYCNDVNNDGPLECQQSQSKETSTEIYYNGNYYAASKLTATYELNVITITVPTVPQLVSPIDGAESGAPSVYYNWQTSSGNGNIKYQLQVDDQSSFSSPLFDVSNITETNKSVSSHNYGTVYYWRVKASNEAGSSNWSNTRSLTTAPGGTSTTATITNGHPTLSWDSAEGAISYRIYKKTNTSGEWNDYYSTTSTTFTDQWANVSQYQGMTYKGYGPYAAYYVVAVGINDVEGYPSNSHYYTLVGITPE